MYFKNTHFIFSNPFPFCACFNQEIAYISQSTYIKLWKSITHLEREREGERERKKERKRERERERERNRERERKKEREREKDRKRE